MVYYVSELRIFVPIDALPTSMREGVQEMKNEARVSGLGLKYAFTRDAIFVYILAVVSYASLCCTRLFLGFEVFQLKQPRKSSFCHCNILVRYFYCIMISYEL